MRGPATATLHAVAGGSEPLGKGVEHTGVKRAPANSEPGETTSLTDMDPRLRLVLLSFLMLFVELALIRWLGSNIIYMSYFSNFVLLGSFLGIGIGFLRARARVNLFPWAPISLALLVAFVRVFPVQVERSTSDLIFFGSDAAKGLPIWVALPIIFMAVAATLAMIAEGVARCFIRFTPLRAYRLDVAGSILGILAFTALSFLHAPPVAWGIIAGSLFLILQTRRLGLLQVVAALGLMAMLAVESIAPFQSWSPYYKVTTLPLPGNESWNVFVNGIPHQEINSTVVRKEREPVYMQPYIRSNQGLEDVLVVGAGNGTDVALALEQGADRVDAVEIDPRLYELGKELHPDRPYQDERVNVHIEDARAFLERSSKRYDLILFALPDSLTLVAGQSSLRLESYLFTIEAMEQAAAHLKPRGVFSMYNFYREGWLVDRLALTLKRAFGHPPCIDRLPQVQQLAVLTVSTDPAAVRCETRWAEVENVPEPVTDDYPFVYLRTRSVPGFYVVTILLILVASLLSVRLASGPLRRMLPYVDLFFMGAAFLLLETKNVVQFSLLFGSTWVVNSIVFTGILATVLLAIEFAERIDLRRPLVAYALLLGSLGATWAVPPEGLLQLSLPLRMATATVLAFAPVFIANVIFAQRFRDVSASGIAFGANLLGAMFGGLLEYGSLVVGFRGLLGGVALLYLAAFLTGRSFLASAPLRSS